MLVGDIIYNDSFDFNGNYAVYDVSFSLIFLVNSHYLNIRYKYLNI